MRNKNRKLTWERANRLIAEHTQEIVSDDIVSHPVVSVSVVTYNHASYIAQALDSVLEQETEFPFEILIGDDCSTDGTREIVQAYQKAHPEKIRLFQSTSRLGQYTGNGRLNNVRNLKAARGEFVAFLEGDDFWCDQSKLAGQIDWLRKHQEYTGSFHETDQLDGREQFPWREFGQQLDFGQCDVIADLSLFHTSSFVFRRQYCDQIPLTMLTVQSFDMAWFAMVSSHGPFRRIPHMMSVYRKHGEGITERMEYQGLSLQLERYAMWKNLSPVIDPLNSLKLQQTIKHHRSSAANHISSIAELQTANRVLLRTLPWTAAVAFDSWFAFQRMKSAFARMRKLPAKMRTCLSRLIA